MAAREGGPKLCQDCKHMDIKWWNSVISVLVLLVIMCWVLC
jgi:hypothetical protein